MLSIWELNCIDHANYCLSIMINVMLTLSGFCRLPVCMDGQTLCRISCLVSLLGGCLDGGSFLRCRVLV
jgi:hypothetical protein